MNKVRELFVEALAIKVRDVSPAEIRRFLFSKTAYILAPCHFWISFSALRTKKS